ncbi:hypothetical protein P4478_00245 [Bacillus subtilis]|nr:hypothetical protein [Bacillus subtilis]
MNQKGFFKIKKEIEELEGDLAEIRGLMPDKYDRSNGVTEYAIANPRGVKDLVQETIQQMVAENENLRNKINVLENNEKHLKEELSRIKRESKGHQTAFSFALDEIESLQQPDKSEF